MAAAAIIAASLVPLAVMWWHHLRLFDPRIVRIWTIPILLGTSIAGVLATAAFWLTKKQGKITINSQNGHKEPE
jgi:glucan phosphoethanolaminetransferase (alkaline phosphatase superfamily)